MVKCACGCGGEIVIKKHHKYYGIPKYIHGHNNNIPYLPLPTRGELNPNWKGGWKWFCIICGKKISRDSKTCMKHTIRIPWNKGTKNVCKSNITSFKKGVRYSPKTEFRKNAHYSIKTEFKKGLVPWNKGLVNHLSEKTIKKLRISHIGKLPNSGAGFGKHSIYNEYHLRSSWELEFAKFLDSINEPWTYESKTFLLEINSDYMNKWNTSYTPDFYLPNRNLWIEIKGWWRPGYKEKFEAFLEKYPEERIKLIMHKPPYTEEDLE